MVLNDFGTGTHASNPESIKNVGLIVFVLDTLRNGIKCLGNTHLLLCPCRVNDVDRCRHFEKSCFRFWSQTFTILPLCNTCVQLEICPKFVLNLYFLYLRKNSVVKDWFTLGSWLIKFIWVYCCSWNEHFLLNGANGEYNNCAVKRLVESDYKWVVMPLDKRFQSSITICREIFWNVGCRKLKTRNRHHST